MKNQEAKKRALKIIVFLLKKALANGDFENCIDDDTEYDEVEMIKGEGCSYTLALEEWIERKK